MITSLLRLLFTKSLKPFIFTNDNKTEFNTDVPELGLYVHIPFCLILCPFCPYNKVKYKYESNKQCIFWWWLTSTYD